MIPILGFMNNLSHPRFLGFRWQEKGNNYLITDDQIQGNLPIQFLSEY